MYHDGAFRMAVSKMMTHLQKFNGLHGARPYCVFKNERITTDEATTLFTSERSKKLADVRIVLSEADIPADELNVNSKALFLVVGGDVSIYSQSSKQSRNFRVDMNAAYAHLFVADYFSEIYFANSAYPLRDFLAKTGNNLEKLYGIKNNFTTNRAIDMPDLFGIDRSPISYTCIFNSNRTTTSLIDSSALNAGVQAWDRLILDQDAGLCPTKEQTMAAVAKWPKVGGSLNIRKVSALYDTLPRGAYLLAVQKRATSVRQSRSNHSRVRGLLGSGMSREANLSKAVTFIDAAVENSELNWALDSNFAQVFRVWKC